MEASTTERPTAARDTEAQGFISGPDAEKGKLFEVPRVAVTIDDTDPTVLKVAFSGGIELERSNATDVELYNRLKDGKNVSLEIEAHVKGASTTHRRDNDGNVDAVVQTKSLVIHSIDTA